MPKSYLTKIGDRFGTRTVISLLSQRDSDGHRRVEWRCDCGNTGAGGLKALRLTKTCPKCRSHEQLLTIEHGHASRAGRTKLYDCWANMMGRTRAKHGRNVRWYAGIKVCPEWQTFEGFRDWAVANGYQPGLSLERIFNTRDYEPGNCEWITRQENSRRGALRGGWRKASHTPIEMLFGET